VAEALRATGGNVSKAAELLAIHRRQIQRLILRYKIDRTNPS
jgi:ActR/RegA family two-component response regulator